MQQRQGPGAEAQARAPGGAAEIEVVVVESKTRVKAHARALQGVGPGSQEHAVEQLYRHGRRAEHIELATRGRAVADGAAEEGMVPAATVGIQPPGDLAALVALVACHSLQIEARQSGL